MLNINRKLLILLVLLLAAVPAMAQERTVGVMVNADGAYDGLTLFVTLDDNVVYLMDNDGRIIHTWTIEETKGVRETHLLENGNLIVTAAARDDMDESLMPLSYIPDGSIREYTWDGELVWEHQFLGAETHQHHAIDIMPNGNILAIAWDYHSLDEALAMGLDSQFAADAEFKDHPYLIPDIIIEVDPSTDEWVWQWDTWDHLVQDFDPDLPNYGAIAEHPRRIDINYQSSFLKGRSPRNAKGAGNWMHTNSVNYNPELDQIALSVRLFDEFWIIDRSLSAEAAAGSAGDLLYRWGNPFTYMRGGGIRLEDRQLFAQHDVHWIDAGLPGAGNILLFNNRNQIYTDEEYSSILELKLPLRSDGSYDWDQEAEIVWSYVADGFHSSYVSGAQRLPNGNTLITEGDHGQLIEVRPDGEVVWEFVNPKTRGGLLKQGDDPTPAQAGNRRAKNHLFRVHKYPRDYPGFAGKDMTAGERLVD